MPPRASRRVEILLTVSGREGILFAGPTGRGDCALSELSSLRQRLGGIPPSRVRRTWRTAVDIAKRRAVTVTPEIRKMAVGGSHDLYLRHPRVAQLDQDEMVGCNRRVGSRGVVLTDKYTSVSHFFDL